MEILPQIVSIHEQLIELFGLAADQPNLELICDEHFNSLALDLFRFQCHSNEPYRRLCEARRVSPGSIDGWTQIPAVPTAAFKEFDLSCLPPEDRTHVFFSSGTSERRRSRHFHNATSLELYERSLLGSFRTLAGMAALADETPPTILSLTPSLQAAPNSSLVHMFQTILGEFGSRTSMFLGRAHEDGLWAVDFELAKSKLNHACAEGAPVWLFGTAFLLVHLLDSLTAGCSAFQLPSGSLVLETGGYKGRSRVIPRPELHRSVCDRLGVHPHQILCEYGMCELSSQAYSQLRPDSPCETSRLFQFPPWTRAQIISPESGLEVADSEPGLLRIFDLANAWSVSAIQTEDLAVRRGATFELTGRAQAAEPRGCSIMAAT